jgi:hypothetical protein
LSLVKTDGAATSGNDNEKKVPDFMNEGVQNIDHKKKYDKIQILVDAVIGDVDDIAIMGER